MTTEAIPSGRISAFVRWVARTPWPVFTLGMLQADIIGALFVLGFLRFGLPPEDRIQLQDLPVLNLAIFQVLLPALAPLIDIFLIYGLLALDPVATIKLWLAVLAIQMFAGLLAFMMERENPLPLLWMPLQQLAYRQLMYGVLIKSLGTALAGARLKWQKLKRVGDFGALGAPGGAR